MSRIPQSFIDELMARVDIVDVIDSFVPLKKAGKDHKACCPFHNEKTPSFTVSQQKQFYHCFGCQANGTALGFLMEYANMSFPEAVEELADRVGLEVPHDERAGSGEPRAAALFEVLGEASEYYRHQLREHPQAHRAVEYLKSRGLTGAVAKQFALGYAPPGWSNLSEALAGEGRREREKLMLQAGLSAERGPGAEGVYDRFRDRIVFPIHDRRGRVLGFGGRVIDQGEPKYLNSPESPVFHKGRELYGLYQARKVGGRLNRLLVVEGYMDVVALFQHDITYAVATLGTAATPEHVERLFRSAADVTYCFDGDEAGRRAAWRALENTLPAIHDGRQAFFMFLPEHEDPDTLVRRLGRAAFERQIGVAKSLTTFLFDELSTRVDLDTIDGRARLVELAKPLVTRMPDGALRRLVYARLGELSGMDVTELSTMIDGRRAHASQQRGVRSHAKQKRRSPSLVRRAITLLVHYPQLARLTGSAEALAGSGLPGTPLLAELVEVLCANPNLTTGGVLEHFRNHDHGRHLTRLASEEAPAWSEELEQEFKDCVARLLRHSDEARFEHLRAKASEGPLTEAERREFAQLARGLK